MDESGAPVQQLGQAQQPQQQPQGNQLGGLTQPQGQPRQLMTKDQVMAALHHFGAIQKQFGPLLKSPMLGKSNMRPKIFDKAAALIGERVMSVPEVMTGIKDLPDDPVGQKKWIEKLVGTAAIAERKVISDYVSQPPDGTELNDHGWSPDTHRDHMQGLMARYK